MKKIVIFKRGWMLRAGVSLALALVAIASQVHPTFAWGWPERTRPVETVATEPVVAPYPGDLFNVSSVNWGG